MNISPDFYNSVNLGVKLSTKIFLITSSQNWGQKLFNLIGTYGVNNPKIKRHQLMWYLQITILITNVHFFSCFNLTRPTISKPTWAIDPNIFSITSVQMSGWTSVWWGPPSQHRKIYYNMCNITITSCNIRCTTTTLRVTITTCATSQ